MFRESVFAKDLKNQRKLREAREQRDKEFGALVKQRVADFVAASQTPDSRYIQTTTDTEVYKTVQVFEEDRDAKTLVATRKVSKRYGHVTSTLHIPGGPAVENSVIGTWFVYGTSADGSRIIGRVADRNDSALNNEKRRLPVPPRRTTVSATPTRRS